MKKKIFVFLTFFPLFLFGGVFEHLLGKDVQYLFQHQFRCHDGTCISPEKNIFDNDTIESSVKFVKAFLDHEERVFKVEVELNLFEEDKEAFYNAIIQVSDKSGKISYDLQSTYDKYGNHSIIYLIDKERKKSYMNHLTKQYAQAMKSYKPEAQ